MIKYLVVLVAVLVFAYAAPALCGFARMMLAHRTPVYHLDRPILGDQRLSALGPQEPCYANGQANLLGASWDLGRLRYHQVGNQPENECPEGTILTVQDLTYLWLQQ